MQELVVFLSTKNELSEKETKKSTPIYISIKNNKILRMNLTEEVKDLY